MNDMTHLNYSVSDDPAWMRDAECARIDVTPDPDPDPWFGDRRQVDAAKRICATCPVQEPCLAYALANRIEHGVWGGTSARERRRMRAEAA